MEKPIVSFIILDIKNHYLTPLTIESILKQTEKRYEIIVLTQHVLPQDFENLREYNEFIKIMKHTSKDTNAKMMNEAIKLANGKYLHFLFPGEVCLSKYSLKYAVEQIEKRKSLDLVCFFFLKRDIEQPPEVTPVSFAVTLLGGERFPIFAKDCLFSKKKLKEFGGFNTRYQWLESFDMITKIHLNKGNVLCCSRVFVDYELHKRTSKAMMGYLKELVTIIYRNFGFFKLMHWYMIREVWDLFLRWTSMVKHYFLQAE